MIDLRILSSEGLIRATNALALGDHVSIVFVGDEFCNVIGGDDLAGIFGSSVHAAGGQCVACGEGTK